MIAAAQQQLAVAQVCPGLLYPALGAVQPWRLPRRLAVNRLHQLQLIDHRLVMKPHPLPLAAGQRAGQMTQDQRILAVVPMAAIWPNMLRCGTLQRKPITRWETWHDTG